MTRLTGKEYTTDWTEGEILADVQAAIRDWAMSTVPQRLTNPTAEEKGLVLRLNALEERFGVRR